MKNILVLIALSLLMPMAYAVNSVAPSADSMCLELGLLLDVELMADTQVATVPDIQVDTAYTFEATADEKLYAMVSETGRFGGAATGSISTRTIQLSNVVSKSWNQNRVFR